MSLPEILSLSLFVTVFAVLLLGLFQSAARADDWIMLDDPRLDWFRIEVTFPGGLDRSSVRYM